MASHSEGLPLIGYVRMVWRRRLLIMIIALAMAVPAFVVSALQTAQYQATGRILVGQPELDENFNLQVPTLTETQVNNLVAILTGSVVSQDARQQGGTSVFTALPGSVTNVVTLTAQDPDPQRAAATIGAYVQAFSDYLTQQDRQALESAAAELQERISQLQGPGGSDAIGDQAFQDDQLTSLQSQLARVQAQQGAVESGVISILDPQVPQSPISPTPVRNALLALVLGLVLGISLAILLETVGRKPATEPPVVDDHTPGSSAGTVAPNGAHAQPVGAVRAGPEPVDVSVADTARLSARTATSNGPANGTDAGTGRRTPRPYPSTPQSGRGSR